MRNLQSFLESIDSPMRRAKAQAALEMQVRVNGADFMCRYQLIESRIAAGSRLASYKGETILQRPDGAFLDARNATRTGLDYAGHLLNLDQ